MADNKQDPTAPVDYAFEARLKLAGELADKFMVAGWEPGVIPSIDSWEQAVMATGRKKRNPSDETKALTLKILDERWKERSAR